MFVTTFAIVGLVTKLKSVPISDEEKPLADEASRAIYELATEQDPRTGVYTNPWLHFLVTPGSKWMALAGSLAPFAMAKYQAVTVEVQAIQIAAKRGNTSTDARATQTVERDPEPPGGQIVG